MLFRRRYENVSESAASVAFREMEIANRLMEIANFLASVSSHFPSFFLRLFKYLSRRKSILIRDLGIGGLRD